MKKQILKIIRNYFGICALSILSFQGAYAQAPEKISYQAVIRNAANELVVNTNVGMQLSVLQDNANGTPVYVETHSTSANDNGLVSLELGTGTVVSGVFANINWGMGSYYLKTETDPTGGTNYTITGVSQLLSVPYALHAKNGIPSGGTQGQVLTICEGEAVWTNNGICPSAVQSPNAHLWPEGYVHCNPSEPTEILEVTNPVTGRIWMDRNLGATQVAQSFDDAQSYGSFFQWGRFADGHQCVNQFPNENVATSMSILTQSQTDSPQHGFFIHGFDWRTQPNNSLWQGVNGVNNPCPLGFRLPTISEWEVERNTWINVQSSGAFASLLKLPSAGFRSSNTISVAFAGAGTQGLYWSSSPDLSQNSSLVLGYNEAFPVMVGFFRAQGCSVRCIKD